MPIKPHTTIQRDLHSSTSSPLAYIDRSGSPGSTAGRVQAVITSLGYRDGSSERRGPRQSYDQAGFQAGD